MAEPTNGGRVPASLRVQPGAVSPGQEGIEATPNPREWLEAMRRHVRLAVGVAGSVVAIAAYLGYTEPLLYRATSVVRLVDARRALAGGLIGGAGADVALLSANPVMSQVEVLRSRATAGAVVDDMPILRIRTRGFPVALVRDVYLAPKVQWDSLELRFARQIVSVKGRTAQRDAAYGAPIELDGIRVTIAEPPTREDGTLYVLGREGVIGGLTRGLLVRQRDNTDVIDIAFTAADPERAQQVANRVAQVFQAGNAQAAQQQAKRRREFIETQLKFNDSLLADARQALSTLRAREPGTTSTRPGEPGSSGGLQARRQELELERQQYANLLGQLRDTNRVTRRVALRNLVASPAIGGNAVVSRLYDQLVQYETVHDSLTTGDWARAVTNPDVQRLLPLIATTEANLVGAVQGVVASLDARIGVLNDLQARSLATARQLSTTQAADELLAEQVENARRIADELRTEYQKARIAEAVEAGQVEIVDLAPLPGGPIGVGWPRTVMFGLLLGVLLGGGSAFLADQLNRSVHRREDVAHLGLPVLGIVPHANGNSTDGAAPVVEAMRGIRFNVMHAHGVAGPALFTITSPGSREGKSFVASNLALAFADAGHRTLLIDGDLRRGSLYRILNTRRKPGLTDVLHGEIRAEQAIQATRYPPLFFVGCGTARYVPSRQQLWMRRSCSAPRRCPHSLPACARASARSSSTHRRSAPAWTPMRWGRRRGICCWCSGWARPIARRRRRSSTCSTGCRYGCWASCSTTYRRIRRTPRIRIISRDTPSRRSGALSPARSQAVIQAVRDATCAELP